MWLGTHFCVGAQLIWFSFFCHSSSHIRNKCFIWNAAFFHFPPHCHGDSPSKPSAIEIPARICCNCHTAGRSYSTSTPSLSAGRKKNCLKIKKHLLVRHAAEKMSRRWCDFVAMETEPTHHLFVICVYRIRRKSRSRPGPSCASSVCHHELQRIKTPLFVVAMMPVRVIIINWIKIYCQKQTCVALVAAEKTLIIYHWGFSSVRYLSENMN